jgi:hypothetical protein
MIAVILFCGAYVARNGWKMLREHFDDHVGVAMIFGGGVIVGAAAWAMKGGAA